MIKKFTAILIVGLLGWNLFLSMQMNSLKEVIRSLDGEQVQIIENKTVEFTTEITNVVESSVNKVVGISSYRNDTLIGSGSGAIISVDGFMVEVITNNHVINNANRVDVVFANGQAITAEIIGSDVFSDLALLQVEVDFPISAFKIGDSASSKVGEWVLAIGSPLGLNFQGSVTLGILSGKDRTVSVDISGNGMADWDMNVLQTDAAINPGNSGGPLINMNGELIGINSMKIVLQTVEGMGFSIPINEVVPIVAQLREYGEVIRPVLGISAVGISELSFFQKNRYGIDLSQTNGLLITSVMANSPALEAGIRNNDILLSFDQTIITSFKQFRQLLYSKNVNDIVDIVILRDGVQFTVSVVLG